MFFGNEKNFKNLGIPNLFLRIPESHIYEK